MGPPVLRAAFWSGKWSLFFGRIGSLSLIPSRPWFSFLFVLESGECWFVLVLNQIVVGPSVPCHSAISEPAAEVLVPA